jgi:hypothetical protein
LPAGDPGREAVVDYSGIAGLMELSLADGREVTFLGGVGCRVVDACCNGGGGYLRSGLLASTLASIALPASAAPI